MFATVSFPCLLGFQTGHDIADSESIMGPGLETLWVSWSDVCHPHSALHPFLPLLEPLNNFNSP